MPEKDIIDALERIASATAETEDTSKHIEHYLREISEKLDVIIEILDPEPNGPDEDEEDTGGDVVELSA